MMEVKQNTAVDLNDLLVPTKSADDGTDELDDAVMTDLSDNNGPQEMHCNLIKSNDNSNNGLVVATTNGDDTLSSLMDMEPSDTTGLDDVTVSTELEEALLAEDDVLPIATTVKGQSAPTVAVEDILADKVETSNSTTSSTNVRDPGDDLDTLLSKINDIVDDCLDNEVVGSGPVPVVPCEEKHMATEKQEPTKCTSPVAVNTENLDESIMIVDDPTDEENNVKIDATLPVAEEVMKDESVTTEVVADSAVAVKIDEELSDAEQTETEEQSSAIEAKKEIIAEAVEIEDKVSQETDEASAECGKTEEQESTEKIEATLNLDQETRKEESDSLDDKKVEESVPIERTTEEKEETCNAVEPLLANNIEEEQRLNDLGEDKNTEENNKVLEAPESQNSNVEETTDNSDIVKESPTNEVDLETTKDSGDKKEEDKSETEGKQDDKIENVDNTEDSDDEIVFYVDDKPTESGDEKSKDKEAKETSSATNEASTEKNEEKEKTAADHDTVVILDDDDEVNEEADKKHVEENKSENTNEKAQSQSDKTGLIEKSPSKEAKETNNESLDMDNSDNARDEFATEKTANASTAGGSKSQEVEETNSNCSSSSNLLLEAKATENSGDGPTQEENENENEEEDDDGDVELIENESKEAENSSEKGEESTPPAKRQRLSEDDSQVSMNIDETSNKSQTVTESTEKKTESHTEAASVAVTTSTSTATTTSLKRSHDVIELELDDKSNDSKASTESSTKKARTEAISQGEDAAVASITDTPSEEKIPKEEVDDTKDDVKDIKKMVPSYKPIPLYPPPKMETLKTEKTFSLDFLKKFRKSFDKMTKQDLEEMVLQKVVEAIIHKSEFAEMRELLEKQEKLISSHRTKITELSKQFRDLEMVHNRVVKDIDQRNSQFIMPVKITRAVGLQVYIPNKKSVLDTSSNSSTTSSNIPASSPQRQAVPHGSLTSPQRPILPAQSSESQIRPGSNLSSAVNAAITNAVRRGCAQKVTPTRPMPSSNMTSGSASGGAANSSSVYRSNLSQAQAPPQPRILNKNASTATAAPNTNATGVQRNRYMPANVDPMRLQQQQQQQQQQATASRPTTNNQRIVTQSKPPPSASNVPRRSDSASSAASNNSTTLDSYMNTLSQLTGGNTAVSITPAKPKEKAVIDLTDEDEMPAATPASNAQPANNGPAASQGPQQRRSLPTQNNGNASAQYGRNAPPLARIPPINLMANSNKNRQAAAQGQKSSNSSFASTISTPPGTSITRINVAANTQNTQRVKYSHPAPLPATPPQAFNPAWKLPPPRPTIRISNLDNGIVISWTMEESMDRHAECVSYQIYAYQETSGPPMADSWRHVGDVKAMLLPMAVTLTQFQEGQRYFFAVRAVDCHQRYGPFSLPKTWS